MDRKTVDLSLLDGVLDEYAPVKGSLITILQHTQDIYGYLPKEAIEYITDDDLIEVTPKSIRLRKKILNTELRMKEMMRKRRELEAQKK